MICILSNLTKINQGTIPRVVTIFVIYWNLHFSTRLQRLEVWPMAAYDNDHHISNGIEKHQENPIIMRPWK